MVKKLQPRAHTFDLRLAIAAGALLVIGLIMLYSASTVESLNRFGVTTHFLKNQIFQGIFLGGIGLYVYSRLDYRWWQKLAPVVVGVALVLLLLVKFPGIGFTAGGASRWIHLGPIFLQPAELAKLAIVVYCAAWLAGRKQHLTDFFSGVLPMLCIVGLFSALILWQPDFGTMISLLGTAAVMIIVAGTPWKWVASLAASGVALLFLLIKFEPYRAARLLTFLNPSLDPQGAGYQITQALLAIGSGGVWGLGYGLSRQKHNFLPEALGDSVFAIVAEELGFVRVILILVLFVYFFVRGLKIAQAVPDMFGRLLACGLVAMMCMQVIINIGAIIGILPLTGIPLPFFSYGSSALIVNMCAVGILLQVSKHTKAI